MAIEAPLSSYKKKNLMIIAAVLIGIGLWFAYDGYKNQKFIDKHTKEDGTPDSTLSFNRKSPPFFIAAGVLAGVYLAVISRKKVVADENNLQVGCITIAYDTIEAVNKTHFDSKGYFILTYSEGGQNKDLKISDRTYDNLPAVLDHIVTKIS